LEYEHSSPSASKTLDHRQIQTLTSEYSEFLNRIFNGAQGGLDLQSLCILPGALRWVIYVDILILSFGGNLLDTVFSAIRGALYDTRMPKVSVESSEGHHEFDVADEETEMLQGRDQVPIAITLTKVIDPLVYLPFKFLN
jgi:exosome complex component RRP42